MKYSQAYLSSYPTYEEWKQSSLVKWVSYSSSFLSYLWGMETKSSFSSTFCCFDFVLILPMRNGNIDMILEKMFWIYCSYPTYEEWKQAYYNDALTLKEKVLILPMRNGNNALLNAPASATFCSYPTYEEWKPRYWKRFSEEKLQFLSYLWGMETNFTTLWINSMDQKVLILPMRNGNFTRIKPSSSPWENAFLSYLWGMETRSKYSFTASQISSYPTYEEWKRD